MTKSISNIISWIFHPVLVPLWGIILIFNSGSYISHLSWDAKRIILGILLFATILMPIISVSLLYFQHIIKDVTLSTSRDRIVALTAFSIFYIFCWYLLQRLPISRHIQFYMLNLAVLSILSLLINIKWNISTHMIGIGALVGTMLGFAFRRGIDLQIIIMILFIAAGLTGYSRLIQNKNNPTQVYVGFLLGFALLFASVYFL